MFCQLTDMKLSVVTVFVCIFCHINSSKILVITSMPSYSHFTLAFRLAKELADREHEVSFINPYPQKTPIKHLKDISIEEVKPFVAEVRKTFAALGEWGSIGSHLIDLRLSVGLIEHTFNSTNVQNLLNSEESFDVVVIEHFINEPLVGIAHHFKAPVIFLAPVASCFRNNYIFGNPGPSSYVPDILGIYTKHMNFWQRLKNFIMMSFHDLWRELVMIPKYRTLFKKYTKTDFELDDVLYNVSLILTTSHPSISDAVPHFPNIIEIGGYHVFPPKKLSEDLQDFLDTATEGVILFSMGSNLKSKDLTLNVRNAVLKSFAKIKVKVLWKFEDDLLEAPSNVKIMSWLPQQDVLAHPNIKCFITHGGLLSTIEAVYHGVPLIGIPVFGDQRSNVAAAVNSGYAVSVPLDELTEENFSAALSEILYNARYRNNVKQRSKIMHDQPLKPIDSAVYWIEHVIRHKGAVHLRSSGSDLKWYSRGMIDILTFLGFTILISTLVAYSILKACAKKLFLRKKKAKKSSSKIKKTGQPLK
ncbi:hypothetical protein Zmor_000405 [Zophobas morio]|uniref:UDP-glucuronosyltransferase n=2 Tax=Zophobas morio TaxID=2755281 RepID=A0AA38MNI9_9CUCU|nr:hypothetical protein Zmor_000405 [Zophobas morio]